MKTKTVRMLALIALVVIFSTSAHAEDLRKFISLSGYWKFSIGDDSNWASPSYNDNGWDQITIPGQWEDQGYSEYNGYAWYRKSFNLGELPGNTPLYLVLGRIDDADEVYLNGKLLGKSGSFPPHFETAYNQTRKYNIPAGYLKENAENFIAIRVYDSYLEGGIVDGHAGLYYDTDNELLSIRLNGMWKFHTGDNNAWKSPDYNDAGWKSISVPSSWENQGYNNYDGYAWYRIKFRFSGNSNPEDLYLALGKIDDIDDVYVNGKLIGNVYDLRKDSEYRRSGWEFNARRVYKIPDGLLSRDGINTIAIRVYDGQGVGGIYEGPVGFMSAENYRKYRNKHYSGQSFWDYVFDKFFED